MNTKPRQKFYNPIWLPLGIALFAGFLSACHVIMIPTHPPHHRGMVVVRPVPAHPPAIIITQRPRLVFLAQYGIYVAPDVTVSLFFQDDVWYYFHQNAWYKGPAYQGPWTSVEIKSLPRGLKRVPPGHLRKIAKNKDARNRDIKRSHPTKRKALDEKGDKGPVSKRNAQDDKHDKGPVSKRNAQDENGDKGPASKRNAQDDKHDKGPVSKRSAQDDDVNRNHAKKSEVQDGNAKGSDKNKTGVKRNNTNKGNAKNPDVKRTNAKSNVAKDSGGQKKNAKKSDAKDDDVEKDKSRKSDAKGD